MKLFITTFFVLLAVAFIESAPADSPTQISNNNVKDIVNVGIEGKINVDSRINFFLMSLIMDLVNQNGAIIAPRNEVEPTVKQTQKVSPEMIENLSQVLKNYDGKKF